MSRSSPIGLVAAIVILAACAAVVQPAFAKGGHSYKAPKAPKAETTKVEKPAAKKG